VQDARLDRRASGALPPAPSALDDLDDLFPRSVRPQVFKALWAVLALLLTVLVLLALRHGGSLT
jgi:hypothetical protein